MTWFQNPFTVDYYGVWVIDDRAHHPTFECKRNTGRGDEIVMVWTEPEGEQPHRFYDLSGVDEALSQGIEHECKYLTLQFALDSSFLDWTQLSLDLTERSDGGHDVAATLTPQQIVTNLNANAQFASLFTASLLKFDGRNYADRIVIKQRFPATRMRFFVVKQRAESVLRFNARAGVAELPTYFARHVVFNRNLAGAVAFLDGVNLLIELDPSTDVDSAIITGAVDARGNSLYYDPSIIQEDWELIKGLTNTFNFTNVLSIGCSTGTVDDSLTVRQICYPAGARVGDLSKKIVWEYDSDKNLLHEFIMPHTLTVDDLIEPPDDCEPQA